MKAVIFTSPHIADEVIIINGFYEARNRIKKLKNSSGYCLIVFQLQHLKNL